ncbi:AraC family transcriptional regulator [Hungatella hathewayi]|uniref:AraC family transcriptional regulator n=1 Tax=Hungatella hathewayi TaxID=154046 RepID=UPI00356AC20D
MKASKSKMPSDFKVAVEKQSQHAMPEMHYHDFYEIYIQDQGTRDHIVSNTFYKLNPRDVMLLKPNILHQSISPEEHTRTIVYFNDTFLKRYFTPGTIQKFLSIFKYNCISLSSENYYKASGIVKKMTKEDYDDPDNTIFIKLAELLMILQTNIRQFPPISLESSVIDTNRDEVSTISPLISYVHENFLTLTNIDEIASTFYITPSHLCRTFKKLTGYTIVQYINILKIQKACGLLHETQKSITDIALECGFNSTMYFCKTFKSVLNITPTDYRKI